MARPAKKENAVTIKVANTEIKIGDVYELVHKKDLDAPHPKNGIPTAKYPTPGNGEHRSIIFDDNINRWDTGFEENSASNRSVPSTSKEALIALYNEKVKKPYEVYYQKDCSAVNDEFWKSYTYELKQGRSFDTKNPRDLFDLFHALKQGKVCEVGERDSTYRSLATYCIVNKEKIVNSADEKLLNKYTAINTLSVLIDGADLEKDDTLYTILEWMAFNLRGVDKESIKKQVLKSFENEKTGSTSIERFLEAYEMTKSPDRKAEMEMFSILSRLRNKGKLEFKRNQFYLDGILLGNTLKDAAKSSLINADKREVVMTEWEKIQ